MKGEARLEPMLRLSWLLGGTLKRKSSKTPPPPVARIRKGRGGDEGPLYVIDVVTMDIGMAHPGCWKSFPTDMLETRSGQGNRHFQMSSPFPRALTQARLEHHECLVGVSRQAQTRRLPYSLTRSANPAASRRSPRRPTALAGNRACSSRGRHANYHLLETLARLTC